MIKIWQCLVDELTKSDNSEQKPNAFPSRLIGPIFDSVNLEVKLSCVNTVM